MFRIANPFVNIIQLAIQTDVFMKTIIGKARRNSMHTHFIRQQTNFSFQTKFINQIKIILLYFFHFFLNFLFIIYQIYATKLNFAYNYKNRLSFTVQMLIINYLIFNGLIHQLHLALLFARFVQPSKHCIDP